MAANTVRNQRTVHIRQRLQSCTAASSWSRAKLAFFGNLARMARSLFVQPASLVFRAGRVASNAHLEGSIIPGAERAAAGSDKSRIRYNAKTALWNAVIGKRK